MSRFDLDAIDAFAAIDAEFGEEILFDPRAESADRTAADGADPARPSLKMRAVFCEKPAEMSEPHSWDGRQTRRPGTASVYLWCEISPHEIFRALAEVGLRPPFAVHKDDQITRLPGGEVYAVAVEPSVSVNGLLKARLNRVGCRQ
jgi:hypothetical protein